MTPYVTSALEVTTTLGVTEGRKGILRGWLRHRTALRGIGFDRGFQWLDGSFVESKEPRDIDVVSFLYRPRGMQSLNDFTNHIRANFALLFDRPRVKADFCVDFLPVDLESSPEAIVSQTRYWLGLFSHRRGDDLWKGMLQTRLDDVADDAAAAAALGPAPQQPQEGVTA
jgi:hypothetical protein